MADIPAQVKGDIAKILAEVSAIRDHVSVTRTWINAHVPLMMFGAVMLGWSIGKIF